MQYSESDDAVKTIGAVGVKGWLRNHPLIGFFLIAYLGTWLVRSPIYLGTGGLGVLPFSLSSHANGLLSGMAIFCGPWAAAHIMTRLTEGPAAVKALRARLVHWRIKISYYLGAIVAMPIVFLAVFRLWPDAPPVSGEVAQSVATIAALWIVYLALGGPLGEEIGWRGYALPRLQAKMHPVTAAVFLGVLWCFWHAPQFFNPNWDTNRSDPGQILAYLPTVICLSIFLSWIANSTQGSLLLVMIAHNSVNVSALLEGMLTKTSASNYPMLAASALLATVALIASRGTLGASPQLAHPALSKQGAA